MGRCDTGSGTHHKENHDGRFYVLAGSASVLIGREWVDVGTGSFVRIPAGVPHDLEKRTDARIGLLNFSIPGGLEENMPEQTIGVIGLGIMGSAVSGNLLKDGFDVIGYDVLIERVRALQARGGRGATSVRAVAEEAPVMIALLPSVRALKDVVSGDKGLVPVGRAGSVLLECSTLPLECKEAARRALERVSIVMLDCPLSGTGAQAATKDLVVYASGDQTTFERCRSVFDGFARASHYTGPFGNGSRFKFVANLLVSIHNVAAAEAFVLGMKAGLTPEMIYEVIASGAGTSRMFEVRGPMMARGSYDQATMKIDVWQKDIQIISDFARELGCPTPLFAAAAQFYAAALAQGRAKEDTTAVCAVLETMAGLQRQRHD